MNDTIPNNSFDYPITFGVDLGDGYVVNVIDDGFARPLNEENLDKALSKMSVTDAEIDAALYHSDLDSVVLPFTFDEEF